MNKISKIFAIFMVLLTVFGTGGIFAASYATYTYALQGYYLESPDAYTPEIEIDSKYMGLIDLELDEKDGKPIGKGIDDPRDLVVDKDMNVYIADAANNRIVMLDPFYKFKLQINKFVNDQGVPDSLNTPRGLYVTDDAIYVADTENNRIVIFDRAGKFQRIIGAPKDEVFPENSIYKPIALAVDNITGQIYVVSSTTYMGVISLNSDGDFQGFIGAQKVVYNLLDIIWRNFQTAEQRALTTQNIATEFNNITIDELGFIYVTTSSIAESAQQAATEAKTSAYAPVKKLNSSGTDIMKRNGFHGPGGEVQVWWFSWDSQSPTGASKIIDVAMGPEGTWSIIDEKRSRVYTYDSDGKLLFIFGDNGYQVGNITSIQAVAYQGDKMLVLDKSRRSITVYNRTEYGDILINALRNNNARRYDLSVRDWEAILQRNSNFDAAYVGIGRARYRAGDWEGAMEYYKYSYDTENYSNAFKMYRKDWVSKYIVVIPIAVVLICVAVVQFFKFAARVNSKTAVSLKKRSFGQEIIYVFHLIFHPFDGFWDLKHEKRGSVRGAFFFLILAVGTFTYQSIGTAYIFSPYQRGTDIAVQITSLSLPLLLWVTANWCLTTLFEGEGSFKDVFIAICYSTAPLPLLVIPSVMITHIITKPEGNITTLLVSIAWVWVGLLIFTGMMVTHDYTLGKNILTCLGTIVGMAFLMFIGLLFSGLLTRMIGFINSVYQEISFRL